MDGNIKYVIMFLIFNRASYEFISSYIFILDIRCRWITRAKVNSIQLDEWKEWGNLHNYCIYIFECRSDFSWSLSESTENQMKPYLQIEIQYYVK